VKIISRHLRAIIILSLLYACCLNLCAQAKDSIQNKNSFSIDLIPLYYDFFDYHMEIRGGIDYARQFKKHWLADAAIDCGMFDEYTFTKFYNYFNQPPGYYSIMQKVKITGFHLMPSCNYYVWQSKAKPGQGVYCGVILDVNYYHSRDRSYNSQSAESSLKNTNQFRTGAGLSLGVKYYLGHHFFAEARTSFFGKVIYATSDKTINKIKALNSQWTTADGNFWWTSNLKFGYAF
jgi:hypothetical protein